MINRTLVTILLALLAVPALQARIIHEERSLYRNIVVEDSRLLRCLKFTRVRANPLNQSCIIRNQPRKLVFDYSKLVMGSVLLKPRPENILVIGLGGGTIIKAFHELFPEAAITAVEIDPAVVAVAREYFDYQDGGGIHTVVADGRVFVKRALLQEEEYDYILLDAFNGDYIPEHLMTREFLQEVKALLTEDGLLVANTFSTSNLYDHESVTYASVFGDYYNLKFSDTVSNRVIFAAHKPLPAPASLADRVDQWQERLEPYDVPLKKVFRSIQDEPDWDPSARVLTDQYAPANLLRGN